MVFLNGQMEVSMKVKSGMDIVMETGNLIQSLIRQSMLVIGWWANMKVKEPYISTMGDIIKENLRKIKNMEKGKWFIHQKISMKENGSVIRSKAKESWIGGKKMKNIKETGKIIFHMVMENIIGLKIKPSTKF